ncbi:hypothetical protein AGMMS50276_03420 [Synergistales bacterium]|nr:hypothetical protein AGMMS50276_03420 [Synergistales bacterium]
MKKQEHTTSLSGGTFVEKSNTRIEFRGKLDSLDALIVFIESMTEGERAEDFVGKLEEVRSKVHDILSCEVTGRACEPVSLWGLSADEIQERSHNPEKYLGLGHIMTDKTMGLAAASLNLLRTKIREAELSACRAFKDEPLGQERHDIIRALNRLSSAMYVLIYSFLPEGYDKTVTFGKS